MNPLFLMRWMLSMANLDKIERFRADCLQDISFFAQNPVAPLHIAPETGPIAQVNLRRA